MDRSLRRGLLDAPNVDSFRTVFPDVRHLELYSGYLGYWRYENGQDMDTITVGGDVRLHARSSNGTTHLAVTDTLWVDYGASITNGVVVTPSLSNPRNTSIFNFRSGSKIAIKNWDALPRGQRVVALSMTPGVNVKGTPDIVPSDEGTLVWDADDKILYARRHADGFFMMFR